jgi:hypothetical protein
MATTTATTGTSNNGGILGSLTSLFTGDACAAGQAAVDNRSLSQKYGSWDSDRKKLTEMTPEEMQALMAANIRKREAVVINASAGLSENGERNRAVTGNGYMATNTAANDSRLGVTSTGSNYAQFRSMGRIAA